MLTATRPDQIRKCERLARRLDGIALRLARGKPALDVALGEVFLRLSEEDCLAELGMARLKDLANEVLGVAPRTFFALCELAKGLRERPLLKKAVLAGEVTPLKARIVMEVAKGEEEGVWVASAMECTVDGLEDLVAEKGGGGDPQMFAVRTVRYRMTGEQQDRLDAALSLAKEVVGYDASRVKLTEEVCRQWLASLQAAGGDLAAIDAVGAERALAEMTRQKDEVSRQLTVHFEACELVEHAEELRDANALGLKARALTLLERRGKFDEPLGRVLFRISSLELWRWLGWKSFAAYCRERLGMSESSARQRSRLEIRLRELPALRKALITGRLTYTKVLQVARHATKTDVEAQIRAAEGTTHQQTKREADAKQDEKDRRKSRRVVRGGREALRVISRAISCCRQALLEKEGRLDEGEALARIGDWYVKSWTRPVQRAGWRSRWRKEALLRADGLCAVPGCTRAAEQLHHLVYQSHGGPDVPENVIGVCWFHHRRCIHAGRLTVRGTGGEYLVWTLKDSRLQPYEQWETRGRDDVRRRPSGRRR